MANFKSGAGRVKSRLRTSARKQGNAQRLKETCQKEKRASLKGFLLAILETI